MKGNSQRWIKRAAAAGAAVCLAAAGAFSTVWGEETELIDGSAMGRYVESDMPLPEGLVTSAMTAMEDGTLRILGADMGEEGSGQMGFWDSSDGGATWEMTAAFPKEYGDVYFSATALAPDGGGAAVEMDVSGNDESEWNFNFFSFDSQGNVTETFLGNMQEAGDQIPNSLVFTSEGTLGALCYGGKMVLLDRETGEVTAQLTEGSGELLYAGKDEFLLLTNASELMRFDGESGEPLERDEALENALFGDGSTYYVTIGGSYPIVMTSDSEGRVYYCTQEGIFAHTMGGGAVEQVVDGTLNTLSNPAIGLQAIVAADQKFYVRYMDQNGYSRLACYTYDPEMPVTPERELTVYSLEENDGLRQLISQFQKQYPDTYVNYQVGMSGQEGITASDALRTLNTDILANNGPDVLMLDGISVETYQEQGLLADLTEILDGVAASEGLLENIAYAYRNEEGTWAVPTRFSIPVAVGESGLLASAGSLEELASVAGDQGNLLPYAAACLPESLYPVYAGGWKNEDGTINQELLAQFVTGVKQIYDAWISGASQDQLEMLEYYKQAGLEAGTRDVGGYVMSLLDGKCRLGLGELGDMLGYSGIVSVNKTTGDTAIAPLNGLESGVFVPSSIVSILNTAKEQERAKDFVTYLLSAQGAGQQQWEGFSVNAAAFESALTTATFEEGSFSSTSSNNQTGEMVELIYSWPTQEEQETLRQMVNGLNTCADLDRVTKDAVLENLRKCMDGELGTDEAVNAIMQTVNLYLAE